jgi:hypothetical protein
VSIRTFIIGDIHGDLDALHVLLGKLTKLTERDTLVFTGAGKEGGFLTALELPAGHIYESRPHAG